MLVKMLDGPFVGQVKDLRSDIGLEFIREGRAVMGFQDDPAPAAAAAPAGAARPDAAVKLREAVRNVAGKKHR